MFVTPAVGVTNLCKICLYVHGIINTRPHAAGTISKYVIVCGALGIDSPIRRGAVCSTYAHLLPWDHQTGWGALGSMYVMDSQGPYSPYP